jgi:DNA adenine methylase
MCYPIKKEDARAGKKFNRNTGKYNAVKKRLSSLKNKLKNIDKLYNEDFEVILQKEDSEDTLFYLDPPYFGKEKFYANHNFGINDHKRMADALKKIKGRFIVSYYYYPELEEWFPKDKYHWGQKDYTNTSGAIKGKEVKIGTEILIMNF